MDFSFFKTKALCPHKNLKSINSIHLRKRKNKLPPKVSKCQSLTINNVLDLFFTISLCSAMPRKLLKFTKLKHISTYTHRISPQQWFLELLTKAF